MKKLIYLIVLALILGLVLTGCLLSNVGQVPTSEQSGIAYLTKHTEGDPFITNLIADGGDSAIDVGDVSVWNDGDKLYVQYVVTAPWYLTETHLHVATSLEDIPQKNGNPPPGKFEHSMEYDPAVTEYTYEISLTWGPDTPLFIAAHAVVELDYETTYTETAWAAGEDFPGKNWATFFYYTVQGPIIIDGILSSGEWDDATEIPVAEVMGTVRVLANTYYLYVSFDVVDSTDARLGENIHGNDQTSINVNPTDGVPWGKPCNIIFQIGADPNAWGGTSSGQTDDWETDWEIDGVQQLLLPGDLETKTIFYSGGNRISEWKVPLASIAPSAGDDLKVGGAIDVGDGSSYVYPIGLDWWWASTYINIPVY